MALVSSLGIPALLNNLYSLLVLHRQGCHRHTLT
jgi:hypothetical protein